jgi:hypothetical protein
VNTMTHNWSHPDHFSLLSGGVLRLDIELGRYVATEYWPDHSPRREARGDLDAMASLLEGWEAADLAAYMGSRPHGQPVGEAPLELRVSPPPAGPNTKEGEAA